MMRVRFAMLPLVLGFPLVACVPPDYPGDPIGEFVVVGDSLANDCGDEAVPAAPSLEFSVELRMDGETPYWRRIGFPAVPGIMEQDGKLRFRDETIVKLSPNPDDLSEECVLRQAEEIEVSLSEGGEPTSVDGGVGASSSFTGSLKVQWEPVNSATCGYVLVSGVGPFVQLPCGISYELDAQN